MLVRLYSLLVRVLCSLRCRTDAIQSVEKVLGCLARVNLCVA